MAERRLTGIDHLTKRMAVLGQLRPTDTNAASLYAPAANVIGIVMRVVICNTTGGGLSYRLFIDADGTTYDETTALAFDVAIAANVSVLFDLGPFGLPMPDSAGHLAARSSAGSGLTFTAWGYELLGEG